MKNITLLTFLVIAAGCTNFKHLCGSSCDFKSPRIERELNFYVASHPSYLTNNFFVYPTEIKHQNLIQAWVYWKEERTLLLYSELEPDAKQDVFAWSGHDIKLDRDTVDTKEEIGGSNYLETHRQWVDEMERCLKKGKHFSVLKADAQTMFPNQRDYRQ